jgi:hypothetical protein
MIKSMWQRVGTAGVVLMGLGLLWFQYSVDSTNEAVAQQVQKENKDKSPDLYAFMRVKLGWMDLILEGMLVDDFKKIEKGALKLKEMSNAEKWRVSNDLMYRNHSEDFEKRIDKLIKVAQEGESLDKATLAWFDTTMSCIECHRWVRTMLIADAPEIDLSRFAVAKD